VSQITILMAVFNGETFLPEQLNSIAGQTHENWTLVAGDDASSDDSLRILEGFKATGHDVEILHCEYNCASENFMALIRHAAGAQWIAFSDQDDVWKPDRLGRGLAALRGYDDRPALFCSRTIAFRTSLDDGFLSREFHRPPSFRNALVQNIAAGNTILLNPAASELVTEAAFEAGTVIAHDWWLYQMITGVGGKVIFDNEPTLFYRQHGANQFGTNKTLRGRLMRLKMLAEGKMKDWNDVNIEALSRSAHRFTPENARLLSEFSDMRSAHLLARLRAFFRLRLHRQHPKETMALWISALLGRL